MSAVKSTRTAARLALNGHRSIRHISTSRFLLNSTKPSKDDNKIDEEDTLQHLYKKKYEFIKKQNLEESFQQIQDNNVNDGNYNNGESTSSTSDEKTFQLTQRLKLLVAGLLAIGATVGGLNVYQNWAFLKSKYIGGDDLESFDEMYERIKEKKLKKQNAIDQFAADITNPNGSDIPGVYISGNNKNLLVADNKTYDYVPVFKRLDVFDKIIVKDITMGDRSGALINDKGDLYQWGLGFSGDSSKPSLKGKKLKRVQISNNAVYALSEKGEVFYLPENAETQKETTHKAKGWFGSYNVSYSKLQINQKIVDISAGLQHIILQDKNGAVFTAATGLDGTKIEKSNGQFGLPEFSQFDAPPQVNEVHEVVLLNRYMKNGEVMKREIKQIAAGDYFSLCLDMAGTIWAFGKNTYGTVGASINYDTEIIPYPTEVQFHKTHFKRNEFPRCIDINAGGETAFATFASSNIYDLFQKSIKSSKNPNKLSIESIEDSVQEKVHLAWGHGLKGELGLGYFVHGSYEPKKVKVLNEIEEFDEKSNKLEKIGVKRLSSGKNHSIATLENNDVYVWGDNEFGQLANGKRIRAASPINIPSISEPTDSNKKSKLNKLNNRLQLFDNGKIHQEIVAGRDTTAIVYKKN